MTITDGDRMALLQVFISESGKRGREALKNLDNLDPEMVVSALEEALGKELNLKPLINEDKNHTP